MNKWIEDPVRYGQCTAFQVRVTLAFHDHFIYYSFHFLTFVPFIIIIIMRNFFLFFSNYIFSDKEAKRPKESKRRLDVVNKKKMN